MPPLRQAALRFAGATALLCLWCAARGVKLVQRDGTLGAGLLAGALFSGEFSGIYLGLRDTTASRLTVFLYTSPETWSLHYSAYAWGSLALQTAIGAFASYLAWMWMLGHYPATRFTFITPVFALALGVALLKEPLTPQLALALCGVAAGIVLVNRKAGA